LEAKDIVENSKFVSISEHYDRLIDENNDPVYDPKPLKEFMDKSDGQYFIDGLNLTPMKDVLEIGVGTGRLAMRVAGKCNTFCGIDMSEKTVIRARKNLNEMISRMLFQK
jgi:ubiquinone/menaquinone biosynthesis C-methylase UbiE